MDVERAADSYAQGWTLRQIGAELGVHWAAVSQQLHRAGVTMRPGRCSGSPCLDTANPDLREQGLTWTEVAEQVGMTRSGVWSRYRNARPPKPPPTGPMTASTRRRA